MMSGALSLITRNAQGGGNDARRLGFSPLPNRDRARVPRGENWPVKLTPPSKDKAPEASAICPGLGGSVAGVELYPYVHILVFSLELIPAVLNTVAFSLYRDPPWVVLSLLGCWVRGPATYSLPSVLIS